MKRADGGNDLGRQSQRPRLEVDAASSTDDTRSCTSTQHSNGGGGGGDDADAAGGVGIDLICNIASFMNPGDDLAGLCVAVGSADAARIRTEYLRDNEQYVAASLAKLKGIPDLTTGWDSFCDNLHVFDKCRDNVTAWMQVNTGWRARCTDEHMERYRGAPLRVEANLVFNNPAVAIEIGLLEVLRFHVEEKGVDVNRRFWNGFNSDNVHLSNDLLIKLALFRGDIDILDFLLSVDGFGFTSMNEVTMSEVENDEQEHDLIVNCFAYRLSRVNERCFEAFIRHPKVNVEALDYFGCTPLCAGLHLLDRWTSRDGARFPLTSAGFDRLAGRILVLLEVGANPHALDPMNRISLIDYARSALGRHTESRHWRAIVQKMEEMSISSAGEQ
mmetsp:Transcript_17983/g.39909  ORF Transcript_17983/g.39909 Transcript_17983/m.39909 type:complete len:387 (+) Transcript_17983:149-1309(+)